MALLPSDHSNALGPIRSMSLIGLRTNNTIVISVLSKAKHVYCKRPVVAGFECFLDDPPLH